MVIIAFIIGYFLHNPQKPQIIIQKEKVFSLPENVTLQSLCDNFYDKQAKTDTENWGRGYNAGFTQGIQEKVSKTR